VQRRSRGQNQPHVPRRANLPGREDPTAVRTGRRRILRPSYPPRTMDSSRTHRWSGRCDPREKRMRGIKRALRGLPWQSVPLWVTSRPNHRRHVDRIGMLTEEEGMMRRRNRMVRWPTCCAAYPPRQFRRTPRIGTFDDRGAGYDSGARRGRRGRSFPRSRRAETSIDNIWKEEARMSLSFVSHLE